MRYRPSRHEGKDREQREPGRLQLFLESTDPAHYSYGDNLTVAQNGHLFVCEDQYMPNVTNHLRGVNPFGEVYHFAFIRIQTAPEGDRLPPDGLTMLHNLSSHWKTIDGTCYVEGTSR